MHLNMASLVLGGIFLALIIYIQGYNFGFNNSYTCHCLNNARCDSTTGSCGSGCLRGWGGPSCQRENIALDSISVSQSGILTNNTSQYGPQLVVDGYTSTDKTKHPCIDTDTTGNEKNTSNWQWWFIDLQQQYSIGYLKIFNRINRTFHLKGFAVHIDDELCFKHTGDSNPPAVFPVECNRTLTGRYVNISRYYDNKIYILLCEVEIYGAFHLKGFAVHIDGELCFKHPGDSDPPAVYPVECSRTLTGSSVNISRYFDYKSYILLCEVEIYVCSRGTYGSECNNFCHCLNYDKCDVKTGKCPNGCQKGWRGESCTLVCTTGTYGDRCSKQCNNRQCKESQECYHVTGKCTDGCTPGYREDDCTEVCTTGTYGDRCNKQCNNRQCKGSQECHHVTGKCTDGCTPGYREDDCTVKCLDGFYGAGCQKNCNNRKCLNNSTCDHVTGECIECESGLYGAGCSKKCSDRKCNDNSKCDSKTGECIDGCQPGFVSTDCTLECNEGFYGNNCSSNCSARFCQSQDQCNNIDGACDCLDGYQGTDCTVIKENSKDVDENTGDNDKDTTIIILAVVMSIFVVISFTFGVYIGIIKYRQYKDKNHAENNIYESAEPTPAHIYDDLDPKEQSSNQSSKNDSAARVPTVSDYTNLESRNPENSTNQSSTVYYNTTSEVSIDESRNQQNN